MKVLYMCGLNEDGQCGAPIREEHNGRYLPVPVPFPFKVSISSVSTGSRHTLALTDTGDVYSWGWGHLGQLGHGENRSLTQPTKIAALTKVTHISAGGVHSGCIDSDNFCYTWGSSTYGQLGLGIEVTEMRKCMVSLPSVVTLRPNGYVKGEKYCSKKVTPTDSTASLDSSFPHLSEVNIYKNALKATRISCGGLHTAAIDLNGNVFCWGKADSGQTGYADWYQAFSAAVCSPRKVEGLGPRSRGMSGLSPRASPHGGTFRKTMQSTTDSDGLDVRAVEVSCGGFHTMVLMENGSVYAMGKQDFGMLGTGTELSVSIDIGAEAPTMVNYTSPTTSTKSSADCGVILPVKAVQISTGGWHTAIINDSGSLYTCGKGEYGRLGLGDEKSRMGLTPVAPAAYNAVMSSIHAPLLPTVPEDAVLGDAGDETPNTPATPIPTGDTVNLTVDTYQPRPPSPPADAEVPNPERVTCVSAGGSHTVWATSTGHVYTVGRVDGGRLGMGYQSPSNPQRRFQSLLSPSNNTKSLSSPTSVSSPASSKKMDRLLSAVDITPMLHVCGASKHRSIHHVPEIDIPKDNTENYKVLQVAAGGSHTAILIDYPDIADDGAYQEFLRMASANILCEEARVDPKQIQKVK